MKIKILNSSAKERVALLLILLCGFYLRYYYQGFVSYPTTDGSLYCEIASNIAKEYKLYSQSISYKEVHTGYPLAKYGITQHPIFPIILAISFKIFGSTILTAKITVVIFGTISIYILYIITKELFINKIASYLSIIIYSFHPLHILRSSHVAGPDVISSFFILIYIYILYRYINESNKNIKIQILLGFLLSLIYYSYISDFLIIAIITFFNVSLIKNNELKIINISKNFSNYIFIYAASVIFLIPWLYYNQKFITNLYYVIGRNTIENPGTAFLDGLSSFWITSADSKIITVGLFITILYFMSLSITIKGLFIEFSKKKYYLLSILLMPLLISFFYAILLYPNLKMNSRFLTSSLIPFIIAIGYIIDNIEETVNKKIVIIYKTKIEKKLALSNMLSLTLLSLILISSIMIYPKIQYYHEYKDYRFEYINAASNWIYNNTNTYDLIATPFSREISWLTQRRAITIPNGKWGFNTTVNTINEFYEFTRQYNISYLIIDSYSINDLRLTNKNQLLNKKHPIGFEIMYSDDSIVIYNITKIHTKLRSLILIEAELYDELDNNSLKRHESANWDWDDNCSNGMYVVFSPDGYAKYSFELDDTKFYNITMNAANTNVFNTINIYLDQHLIKKIELNNRNDREWKEYFIGSYEMIEGNHELMLEAINYNEDAKIFFFDYIILS